MKKFFNKNAYILIPVCAFLLIYMGIFLYLNLFCYTQHVDSDIAVDALLAREMWVEKTLTPDNWISTTERRILCVSALSSLFYGMTGSMVFSMGLSCSIAGAVFLAAVAFTLKQCGISRTGIATALLALCALPINGLRNDGQLVPFVMLLWFLFADYYVMHSIALFLCIGFYLHLKKLSAPVGRKNLLTLGGIWGFLVLFCGVLALSGMRCLQVIALPLAVLEILCLFSESGHMTRALPAKRLIPAAFVASILAVTALAKLHPANVDYPMFLQTAEGMAERLTHTVPAAVLECLGIAGNCKVFSFSALMQFGILAVLFLTVYGIVRIFSIMEPKIFSCPSVTAEQKGLVQALGTSFLLTVFVEVVTTAEPAHNYFFVVWFVVIAVLAVLITHFEACAPRFARLIALCVCLFALCNLFYTYKGCVTAKDNLKEYEEVISYMESEHLAYGYAQFWDSARISVMTDGRITMGNCYDMKQLGMYWWATSTKWYVPNLPSEMRTAYIVNISEKNDFEAQFADPAAVWLGFENDRFAVYLSDTNYVTM